MQVVLVPTHTVLLDGTVTQRYDYITLLLACVGKLLANLAKKIKLHKTQFISSQEEAFSSMAKKTSKTKEMKKKNRSYKIQADSYRVPFLNIKGKFLEKMGVEVGSQWEMTHKKDTIILKKIPQASIEFDEATIKLTQAKQALMVCEARVQYLEATNLETKPVGGIT